MINGLAAGNVVEPGGTAKIGSKEYDVRLNSSPETLAGLANLPIKQTADGATIYIRDVASVTDGSIPQTNIVRQDGHRGVLVTILKSGTASTLDVVSGIRNLLPRVLLTTPQGLKITPIADQSIFVWRDLQTMSLPKNRRPSSRGIFACSPDCFYTSRNIVPFRRSEWAKFWSSFVDNSCVSR